MRGGFGLVLLILAAGVILRFWWVIAAALALLVAAVVLWRAVAMLDRRLDARDRRRAATQAELAALAARADRQNAQVQAGDERGIYGDYPPRPFPGQPGKAR